MEWIVDSRKAYALWIEVLRPSIAAELAMIVWLDKRANDGPPPIIGHSSRGFDSRAARTARK